MASADEERGERAPGARGRGLRGSLIAAAFGLVVGGGAMALWAQGRDGAADREQVGEMVRAYLRENPEVIPEALEDLRDREFAEVVDANRAAYETPFAGAWAGAEKPDVVLVEFFDYACGFCRKSNADVDRLLGEDKKLRVVWRELPVLGPESEKAAQVSLAAARAGRFHDYFRRLYSLGRPTSGAVDQAAREAGLSPQHIAQTASSAEARDELARNFELARAVRGNGTPIFVIGDKVLHGALGYEALRQAIEEARKG
jgi:protein-disulfide isomerase